MPSRTEQSDAGDLVLVTAMLSNATVRAAAQAANVSESTVFRRLRDRDFRKLLKEQRLRVYGHALSRLQVAAEEAVSALVEVMRREGASDQTRLKAAVSILDLAGRGVQPEEVDRRLLGPTEAMWEDFDG